MKKTKFTLSCETLVPRKLAILLTFEGVSYLVDPLALNDHPDNARSLLIGHVEGGETFFHPVPFVSTGTGEAGYEMKLYSDTGSSSFRVKEEEWNRLRTTALYRLCRGVLFDRMETPYEDGLKRTDCWTILYDLSIRDFSAADRRQFLADVKPRNFECRNMSEPGDTTQLVVFSTGRMDWPALWGDAEFEYAELDRLRKQLEIYLDGGDFEIRLPGEELFSCRHIPARDHYYDKQSRRWERCVGHQSLYLLSIYDDGDGTCHTDGVVPATTVVPLLYLTLLEVADRFDRHSNLTGSSYRARLFSPEIEDRFALSKKASAEYDY